MIRGPYVYKGTRPASCEADGRTLKIGESYYLVTGYGSGNGGTFHDACVSTELKVKATLKDVVSCQNPACRKLVPTNAMRKLGACPECGFPQSKQRNEMRINNLLRETRLAIRNGKLTTVKNIG